MKDLGRYISEQKTPDTAEGHIVCVINAMTFIEKQIQSVGFDKEGEIEYLKFILNHLFDKSESSQGNGQKYLDIFALGNYIIEGFNEQCPLLVNVKNKLHRLVDGSCHATMESSASKVGCDTRRRAKGRQPASPNSYLLGQGEDVKQEILSHICEGYTSGEKCCVLRAAILVGKIAKPTYKQAVELFHEHGGIGSESNYNSHMGKDNKTDPCVIAAAQKYFGYKMS